MANKITPPRERRSAAERTRKVQQHQHLLALPLSGRGRWNDIAPFVGVSRETWRQMVIAGKAPAPERVTKRCALFDFAAIHLWIENPANYRAEGNA